MTSTDQFCLLGSIGTIKHTVPTVGGCFCAHPGQLAIISIHEQDSSHMGFWPKGMFGSHCKLNYICACGSGHDGPAQSTAFWPGTVSSGPDA